MKKLIAIALMAGLCLSTGIGCKESTTKTTEGHTNASTAKTETGGKTEK